MTFDAFETTDGRPVELVTFKNGLQTFRITNANVPQTVGALTWEPLAYTRSNFSQSKDSDDSNINFRVPNSFPLVALFEGVLTSNTSTATIERFHEQDATPTPELQVLWKGQVSSLQRIDAEAEMLLQPLSSGAEETPRATYQSLCNVFLFESPGCLLNRDDFKHAGTVATIANSGRNITVTGLRAQAAAIDAALAAPAGPLTSDELDVYWQNGFVITGDGEIRDVVEGDVAGDPDTFRVIFPFRSLAVSDTVEVFAGCNLLMDTCNRKFDNAINHQGFPYVPEVDPANTELPPGSRTSSGSF